MIEILLEPEDFSAIRFCVSPVGEAVLSVRVLQDPARHPLYLDWIHDAAKRVSPADLAALRRLVRPSGYIPDFLTPPPDVARPTIDQEFEHLLATPEGEIVRDVQTLLADGAPADELRCFIERPGPSVRSLVAALRRYWDAVLEPHWTRMLSVLEGDIAQRARLLAVEGPGALFASIHPAMSYDESRSGILVRKRVALEITPGGTGVRLIPRMFAWPDLYVVEAPLPVSIAFPPRGLALWGQDTSDAMSELSAAVGQARASVLLALTAPTHVTELASRLGITKGAISQHLARLSRAGLVESTRHGAYRYFQLSRRGESIVGAFGKPGKDS